jgi:hypothetical protein
MNENNSPQFVRLCEEYDEFPTPFQTGPGVHAASCTMDTESFPGVKRPGRGVDHPTPIQRRERLEVYLYSPVCRHGMLHRTCLTFYTKDTFILGDQNSLCT